jgi:hypothetical protein
VGKTPQYVGWNKPLIEEVVISHGEFLHQSIQFIALGPELAHKAASALLTVSAPV